jgi:hypothetical protein
MTKSSTFLATDLVSRTVKKLMVEANGRRERLEKGEVGGGQEEREDSIGRGKVIREFFQLYTFQFQLGDKS